MKMKWAMIFFCLQVYAHAEDIQAPERPFVTCQLFGQLGNQMFQIATTLAYAWDHNAVPIFPELNRFDVRIPENRDRLFFRLDSSLLFKPTTQLFTESTWNSPDRIPFYEGDLGLSGYFISCAHFHHHRDRLLEVFTPLESILTHLEEKYRDLIAHPNTVSIHVRTFNAECHRLGIHYFLGMDYYRRAMDLFPTNTIFVVFSDRIHWCKFHFPSLGKNFVFIEGNDNITDLFLMSRCKHHIIANSTFSWWGAYLNKSPDKIVVAPRSWHHPDYGVFPLPQQHQIYFDDWILVFPDYSEPYPQDMTKYDLVSQAIDCQ